MPETRAKRVLLPAPFCPISVILAPSRIEKFASIKIGLVESCSYETPLNVISPAFLDIALHSTLPVHTYQYNEKPPRGYVAVFNKIFVGLSRLLFLSLVSFFPSCDPFLWPYSKL